MDIGEPQRIWEIEPIESPAEVPAPVEPEHVGPAQG